jgi:nucleotide-binding universal stress UspA family protein
MELIVVATDGSECSNRAVDYAADLARGLGAGLLIVNVIGGFGLPDEVFKRFTRSQTAWLHELLEIHSAELLKAARDRAMRVGAAPVEIESRRGEVVSTLAAVAEERSAQALVVGKHGASGAAVLLLGSVAHKLVSVSKRPVTVVP